MYVYLVVFLRINFIACHLLASITEHFPPVHPERALVELVSFFMLFFKIYIESISDNLIIQRIFVSLIAKLNLVLLMLISGSREGQPKGQIATCHTIFPQGLKCAQRKKEQNEEELWCIGWHRFFIPSESQGQWMQHTNLGSCSLSEFKLA